MDIYIYTVYINIVIYIYLLIFIYIYLNIYLNIYILKYFYFCMYHFSVSLKQALEVGYVCVQSKGKPFYSIQ